MIFVFDHIHFTPSFQIILKIRLTSHQLTT